jgi:magnesium transporter
MTPIKRTGEHPIAALLTPDIVAMLRNSPQAVAAETEELHPADLADVAESLDRTNLVKLLQVLSRERAADVLEYLNEELRSDVLKDMTASDAALIITQMTPDDRADVLEGLEDDVADEILSEIPEAARAETERLLAFAPDSAGGIMTTEFIALGGESSVEEALSEVRVAARSGRREALYQVYVTDRQTRISGVLSLRELLAAPEGAALRDVARTDVVSVPPNTDREEVARITREYDLVAVPVVDDAGRIAGVVTVDDVIDAIVDEQTEDVQRQGGVQPLEEPYFQVSFFSIARKRAGWLVLLFLGTTVTVNVLQNFGNQLRAAVVLTFFLPLIVSSGGNSGSQSASLITRALAVGDVSIRDATRVLLREGGQGLLLGAFLGAIGFLRVVLDPSMASTAAEALSPVLIATIIGLTVVAVVFTGTVAGAMLPLLLRRVGIDPAIASSPFIASFVDIAGIVLYLAIASWILA